MANINIHPIGYNVIMMYLIELACILRWHKSDICCDRMIDSEVCVLDETNHYYTNASNTMHYYCMQSKPSKVCKHDNNNNIIF